MTFSDRECARLTGLTLSRGATLKPSQITHIDAAAVPPSDELLQRLALRRWQERAPHEARVARVIHVC